MRWSWAQLGHKPSRAPIVECLHPPDLHRRRNCPAESRACSPSRLAPGVHERPEPDCQQDKEQDDRSSSCTGKCRRICRDRPDQEPAEHDASGEKHGAFEQLSVVELSEPKKSAGENQCNDFPTRIDYTWAHRCGSATLVRVIRSPDPRAPKASVGW